MVFDLGNDLAHQVHEVLLDHTDDVEAIGDDLGVGEVPADQGAIGGAQIHADDADVFFAFEGAEVGVKFLRVTAFDDIEDPMGSQIAKSRGELGAAPVAGSLAMDGVLVNAEDGRADTVRTFPGFDLGVFVIEAFDRGGANAFPMREDAASDAIAVVLIDRLAEGLGGVALALDAGEWWDERFATASALIAVGVDMKQDRAAEGIEMTDTPEIRPLAVDPQSPGLATLVWGSLRSTARAVRARCLVPLQMHDGVVAKFLDVLDLIPCNSDFFDLY